MLSMSDKCKVTLLQASKKKKMFLGVNKQEKHIRCSTTSTAAAVIIFDGVHFM